MTAGEAYLRAVPSPAISEHVERDALLIRRIGEGERGDAIGELYDRYARRIFALAVRALRDRGLAEELVQETFVRIWRAAGSFDPNRGSASSWIFTIARRLVIDFHRRAPRAPSDELDDPGALDARLDGLSADHREILELGYRQGLSQSEIAARLAVPLGTVKSRTFHALRALRAELIQRGIDA